jgi:hypothetical protein
MQLKTQIDGQFVDDGLEHVADDGLEIDELQQRDERVGGRHARLQPSDLHILRPDQIPDRFLPARRQSAAVRQHDGIHDVLDRRLFSKKWEKIGFISLCFFLGGKLILGAKLIVFFLRITKISLLQESEKENCFLEFNGRFGFIFSIFTANRADSGRLANSANDRESDRKTVGIVRWTRIR